MGKNMIQYNMYNYHFAVHQKLTKHCKSTIYFNLKKKEAVLCLATQSCPTL